MKKQFSRGVVFITTVILTSTTGCANPFFGDYQLNFDMDAHKNINLWRGSWWNPVDWIYQPDNDNEPKNRLPMLPSQSIDMEKMKVHAKLMAEMIPPLSSPAGGVRLRKFKIEENNPDSKYGIDLMSYRDTNLWPKVRPKKTPQQQGSQRWFHGDYKDAPYLLTHPLYKKIKGITQGES